MSASREVAPGVRVLTLEPASINVVIVHSDGQALVVDTGATPGNAEAVRAELDQLGVTLEGIIITHDHWDHCFALGHFGAVPSYAHAAAIASLREHGTTQRDHLIGMLQDPIPEWIRTLEPAIPTTPISGHTNLRVGLIEVELVPIGHAHTLGDLIVQVPSSGVTITGDLIEVGDDPQLGDANVDGWLAALDTLDAIELPLLVPGHGEPTDHSRIAHHRALLQAAQD